MNFERWISYRYLIASKGRFLTFLNIISVTGVAIGVTALIVVIGVMTGFGNNLREKIIGTSPHIMIEKETGIRDYEKLINDVRTLKEVQAAAPYVQGNIFLESSSQAVGLVLRGIDPGREHQITKVNEYLIKGGLKDLGQDNIIIGNELARYFGFQVGDKVTLISPSSGISSQRWRYELTISGVFKTGMADYDMSLAVVHISKAREIFNMAEDLVSGIGVKVADPYKADDVKKAMYHAIGFSYLIKTWIDINRNL